ncbi:MAG: hypothetical protein M3R39_07375 [Actinomycetota bacterium]|nr:hypothetical protein [Actinomycetota bacterium]
MGEARDVLDLLRRANPVTAEEARSLPLQPLGSLRVEEPKSSGRGPLKNRRLRLALAVFLPGLVALLVAPAFGVGRGVLPFFSGEKAPRPLIIAFASLSTGAPPGMDPGVIASETRRVGDWNFEGKSHTLWVAPTRAGGFCFEWTQAVGGCDREGTVPVSPTAAMAPVPLPETEDGRRPDPEAMLRAHDNGIPIWIVGHVSAKYVASLEVHFEDGTVVRPEITWVSEPIGAGFFVYDIPADHRILGHRAVSLVGLDSDDRRVAEEFLGVGDTRQDPLADAIMSKRHAELALDTRHGRATVYTAPTRYEGRCVFLSFEGKDLALYPCLPKGYGFDNLGALRFVPTPDDVIVAGPAPTQLRSVELRFADGDAIVLEPSQGFFFYELPVRHLAAGAQATEWIGRNEQGAAVVTVPFAKVPDACFGPLPLRPGQHCVLGF